MRGAMGGNGELITAAFREQAIAFPDAVDRALAEHKTVKSRKVLLDKAVAMAKYAEQLKAGIEIERPIAIGVLKLKAGVGELLPCETGGRGKKTVPIDGMVCDKNTRVTYRKLAKHKGKLDEYVSVTNDVPTQTDFIRYVSGLSKANDRFQVPTGSSEWYTPPAYIETARDLMSGIDLDPASCKIAQERIRAAKFYSINDDALTKKWRGRVWMNPPYAAGIVDKFSAKLCEHIDSGDVTQAVVLINNSTETGWFQELATRASAICFPKSRIRFFDEQWELRDSPLQGQAFLYFGDRVQSFCELFGEFGICFQRGQHVPTV